MSVSATPVFSGGPAKVVDSVMGKMWDTAREKSQASQAMSRAALALVNGAPQVQPPVPVQVSKPREPVLPQDPDQADRAETLFRTLFPEIYDRLLKGFTDFIDKYFPPPHCHEAALRWCCRAINEGGTGIRASVERQLWERDRARIAREFERQQQAAASEWAAKGYPMPPGALAAQVAQMRVDSARELSASSREIAIKSFETEIENIRFAVQQLLDWHKAALDAAIRYISALASSADAAAKVATAISQAQHNLASALVQLYTAQVNAEEMVARVQMQQADLKHRAEKTNVETFMAAIDARVKVAMAHAQMLGTQAAAGLNAMNVQASISGSGQDIYHHNAD